MNEFAGSVRHQKTVIGAIITADGTGPDLLAQAREQLTAEYFTDDVLSRIFQFLGNYADQIGGGQVAPRHVLEDLLRDRAPGRLQLFQEMWDAAAALKPGEDEFRWSVDQLRGLHHEQQVGEALATAMKMLQTGVEGERGTFAKGPADAVAYLTRIMPALSTDGTSGRALVLTAASGIAPRKAQWGWVDADGRGRIPVGELTLGAGREGTGKSSFGIWLAARITRGTLPGEFEGEPRAVIIATTEDSWEYTIVPRLIAAGADLSLVFRAGITQAGLAGGTLSLPADLADLERGITAKGAAMVMADPLLSMLDMRLDSHTNRTVRAMLEPLRDMADRTRAIAFGVAHFNKASGTDASSRIVASGAFKDVPRAILAFARDRDGSCVLSQEKNNTGRMDVASYGYRIEPALVPTADGLAEAGRFVLTAPTGRSVSDILAEEGDRDAPAITEAERWLAGYLAEHGRAGQPVYADDVRSAAADAGLAWRTVQRARVRVAEARRTSTMPSRGYWVLKAEYSQ